MNQRASWLAGALRLAIGALLAASAVGKFLDVPGFARILDQYRAFPPETLRALALAIPAAELLLGLWLFSARGLTGAALASAATHAIYAGWSAAALLRGIRLPNCGCFGVFLGRPLNWTTVLEDLILAGASLVLLLLARRRA